MHFCFSAASVQNSCIILYPSFKLIFHYELQYKLYYCNYVVVRISYAARKAMLLAA
jgi:hypothetical protein